MDQLTNQLAALTDAAIVEAALEDAGGAKDSALLELTRRALGDHALLDAACQAIGRNVTLTWGQPPAGWYAAGMILDSGDKPAIARLLSTMEDWSATDQEDVLRLWAPRGRLAESVQNLKNAYGWTPKF